MQPSIPLHLHRSKPPHVHANSVRTHLVCRLFARSIICLSPSSCSGVWDPWPVEHQSCDLNHVVVQKQRLVVLRILATFARFFSSLILTSSSQTCSGTQKISRISVFSLLYCFQLIRRQILHFSSIQRFPALNRRFRFRSVVLNLHHRIPHGRLLGTTTNSQGSLIGWTTGKMFRRSSKIQPV